MATRIVQNAVAANGEASEAATFGTMRHKTASGPRVRGRAHPSEGDEVREQIEAKASLTNHGRGARMPVHRRGLAK